MMRRFNDDLLNMIKENIHIADFAESVYNLEKNKHKSTKQYPVYKYNGDKIIVNAANNSFFSANSNAKGTIIDFVSYIEEVDFVTAVKKLAAYANLDISENVDFDADSFKNNVVFKRSESIKKEATESAAEAQEKAEKWINMYNTLRINRHFDKDIRGISADLLNYLRDKNKIKYYKTDKYAVIKIPLFSNATTMCGGQDVFQGTDGKWQKINHGRAGIFLTGNLKNVTTLTLTESAFDSLSALQLKYDKTKAKNPFYSLSDLDNDLATISINGSLSDLKKEAILSVIKSAGNLQTIVLAFDNDKIGKKYEKEIFDLLKENGFLNKYNVVAINYGEHKDLNEYLQAKKARESAVPEYNMNERQAAGEREKAAIIAR